jgi:hypothetical protein
MRERFELHCRTIGLVLFCIGGYNSLTSVSLLVQKEPDVSRMIPQSALKTLGPSNIAEIQAATSYTWKYTLRALLLSGIAPILMGVYLMRSNNLFVRLCYPTVTGSLPSTPRGTDEPAKLNVSPKVPGSADDKKQSSRYAPPGYSD